MNKYLRLRWLSVLLFLPFIQGCVTQYPQESDITGTWEGISLVYVLFEYEGTGQSYLVAGNRDEGEDEFIVGRLSNFVSREEDFTLDFTGTVEGEVQTGILIGKVYGSRILMRFAEDEATEATEEDFAWMMKSEEFDAARATAREVLDDFVEAGE